MVAAVGMSWQTRRPASTTSLKRKFQREKPYAAMEARKSTHTVVRLDTMIEFHIAGMRVAVSTSA